MSFRVLKGNKLFVECRLVFTVNSRVTTIKQRRKKKEEEEEGEDEDEEGEEGEGGAGGGGGEDA